MTATAATTTSANGTGGDRPAADAAGAGEGALLERVRAEIGAQGARHVARHGVNEAMIAHWCDAMGDANPNYTDPERAKASVHGGLVAPPAMLDVWDRPGLPANRGTGPRAKQGGDDPRGRVISALEAEGFTSVVAVNSELKIRRYVRPGQLIGNVQILDDVSPEKRTGLGVGHFVTSRHRYTDETGAHVGDLLFRILKFRPGTGRAAPASATPTPDPNPSRRPRPAINRDNQFFWDGARAHELRIQRCETCGALFSPPTARCWHCGGFALGFTVASGRATLYSHATVHHPRVEGFRYPLPVGLVELVEGTRLVAEIVGADRDDLVIGMPLELGWLDSHPATADGAQDSRGPISLPRFRPAAPHRRVETARVTDTEAGHPLPLWSVPITPTLIVAGAIATRDYQEVHHDRDLAVARGSADIFLNINTSVGLLERYVTDALGPDVLVRALRVRLGAPAYPYDHLVFTGSISAVDAGTGVATVGVRGRVGLGDHVVGTVEVVLPGGSAYGVGPDGSAYGVGPDGSAYGTDS